ncbi:VOC family protein [Kangiella sp. HZ709]|uniref:VOC family protein n=1 Tax=Kangiella sp. HZ709 TaxID=2666328 RepID=UPI0012AF826C|nr:VOC family protein [Kangiella sp. HZ709]MRX28167.1 VOC family protein [Kangiella sp. HZ709]
MKINLTGVPVHDQAKALKFYTEILGFEKKEDVPMGEHRWLTVTSPEGADGVEFLLEPMGFPPAAEFYKALYDAGIPATSFGSDDIDAEYAKLKSLGVEFKSEPTVMGGAKIAIFDDTCGNYICLTQTL